MNLTDVLPLTRQPCVAGRGPLPTTAGWGPAAAVPALLHNFGGQRQHSAVRRTGGFS